MIQNKFMKLIRAPLSRYLIVNMGGVRFAEKWYTNKSIPTDAIGLFQFTLKLKSMKSVMSKFLAKRRVYGERLLEKSRSKGYVNIKGKLKLLSNKSQNRILKNISEVPREVYA